MIYLEKVQEDFRYEWFTLNRYKWTFFIYDLPWKGTRGLPLCMIYLKKVQVDNLYEWFTLRRYIRTSFMNDLH